MNLNDGFDLLATAPDGVARLREMILSLAAQGKLVSQDGNDEPAYKLIARINREKSRLVAEGKIRRDKPLPEVGEDERGFDLPSGWEWVRLASILSFRIGRTPPTKESRYWASNGIPWVSISDMEHMGKVASTAKTISSSGAALFGYEPLPVGTLLMSFKLTIGKVAVLEVPAYHNEAIASFLPLGGISTEFLKYILPLVAATGTAKDALMGATLNSDSLAKLVIALPPIAEQVRIVAKVDELMRLCNELESRGGLESEQHARLTTALFDALAASESAQTLAENWSRLAANFDLLLDRPEAVDALEQTILQLAVRGLLVPQNSDDKPSRELLAEIAASKDRRLRGGTRRRERPLGEISEEEQPYALPTGWSWARFGQVADISSNLVDPAMHRAMRQVAPDCIEKRTGRLLESRTVAEAGVTSPNHRFHAGQILYSKIRPSLSKAVVVDFEGLCSADMYPVDSYIDVHYLHRYILSQPFLDQVSVAENRVKMPKLNQEALISFLVAVPPLAEQSRIISRLDELHRLCVDLRARLKAQQTCQAHFAAALVEQTAAAGPDEDRIALAA